MQNIKSIAQSHGFTVVSSEELSEIDVVSHILFHDKSGAKLLYLENEDPERAFSISFKTPPVDGTGVFHILEHSVLDGSRKFPVKSPFDYLRKSSMSTYLNAVTHSDHTMYPVTSTNEQDLMNLMDVYLDAVFYPSIYNKRTIFEQEGWHLEFDEDDNELTYNGVVYNEMKGALSNPNEVLIHTLNEALFPGTTYRFVAGGTPEAIPELTYEEFLDSHRRHYRTDNSYITLYGDLDIDRFLAHIDDEYLTPLACAYESDAEKEVGKPNPLDLQSPVIRTGVKKSMVTSPENACAALGFVTGVACASECERLIAIDVLIEAIAASDESPLKRALLDSGIADDAFVFVNIECYQPHVVVVAEGLKSDANESLLDVVEEQVRKLTDEGFDHGLIEATLSHREFVLRERVSRDPDGIDFSEMAMAGWLYDDELSTAYLRYEDAFKHFRSHLEDGYFEQLLREIFLDNDHFAEVEVVPCESVEPSDADKRLADLSNTLNTEARQKIEKDVAALREAQEAPDLPEDLAKLPQLLVSDIEAAPAEGDFRVEDAIVPCLRHHITTHGITYAHRYFDLSCVTFEELPYVKILSMVLGKLETAHHSANEINILSKSKLGNLGFSTVVFDDVNSHEKYSLKFLVSSSSLSDNVEFMATLANEILQSTDFSDYAKIHEILLQARLSMEQLFIMAGVNVAMDRVESYYRPTGVVREQLGGVDFYIFLKDLCNHFDERIGFLENKLAELSQRIFVNEGCLLSYTGTDEDLARLVAAGITFGDTAKTTKESILKPSEIQGVPSPIDRHEAFAVATDVSFTSMGYDRRLLNMSYSGVWLMASQVLSNDYLWNEVRVKGGAYGTGFHAGRDGKMQFYSFRDPHIDETIERFCAAGKWLSDFDTTRKEMNGYIISGAAKFDKPLKPRHLMNRQDGMYFSGVTIQDRLRTRDELIESTVDSVGALGDIVTQTTDQHLVCTVGSRELIEQSKENFNVVDILEL